MTRELFRQEAVEYQRDRGNRENRGYPESPRSGGRSSLSYDGFPKDQQLFPAKLPYGFLTTLVMITLVAGTMLVCLWPINPQQLVDGYVTEAGASFQEPNRLPEIGVVGDSGASLAGGLVGTFYVTPEEAADLMPGIPMTISVDGFPDEGYDQLKGTVIAQSGETIISDGPADAPPLQRSTVGIMVQIGRSTIPADADHRQLRPGLAIKGRFYRKGNKRRVLDSLAMMASMSTIWSNAVPDLKNPPKVP